jgi:hypothetical protein
VRALMRLHCEAQPVESGRKVVPVNVGPSVSVGNSDRQLVISDASALASVVLSTSQH